MHMGVRLIGMVAAMLTACSDESDGFLSSVNACHPNFEFASDADADASTENIGFEDADGRTYTIAQKTDVVVEETTLWGVETRMTSDTSLADSLELRMFVGEQGADDPSKMATELPDGQSGSMAIGTPIYLYTPAGTNWIRTRFKDPLVLKANQYAWIVLTRPSQSINVATWQLTDGRGLMSKFAEVGYAYREVPGKVARYRMIQCE